MMRFTGAIATAVAAVLVLPGAVLGGDETDGLGEALSGTLKAIAVLGGIQDELEQQRPEAIPMVLALTEPALPPGPERDTSIAGLRNEVNLLQNELDVLESQLAAGTRLPWHDLPVHGPDGPVGVDPSLTTGPGITTGLDDATRAYLRGLGVPARRPPGPSPLALLAEVAVEKPPVEPGYSADVLRQAQAAYRAGLYQRGIELLEAQAPPTDSSLYWRARCHERLDQLEAAAALYTQVIERGNDSIEAARAATDLEFLRWKQGFERVLPPATPSPGGTQ